MDRFWLTENFPTTGKFRAETRQQIFISCRLLQLRMLSSESVLSFFSLFSGFFFFFFTVSFQYNWSEVFDVLLVDLVASSVAFYSVNSVWPGHWCVKPLKGYCFWKNSEQKRGIKIGNTWTPAADLPPSQSQLTWFTAQPLAFSSPKTLNLLKRDAVLRRSANVQIWLQNYSCSLFLCCHLLAFL